MTLAMLALRRAAVISRSTKPQMVWSPPTAVCQGAFAESSIQGASRYARLAGVIRVGAGCQSAGRSLERAFSSTKTASAKADEVPLSRSKLDMAAFPLERIRNLSIIAHIDHGKSTLADRLLQLTGTLPASSSPQFLDKLKVERERGITVKAQTVSLIHRHTDGEEYLINLIDTPGHVDFSYEVSRSLGACEGGLLLVDCSQGIQAQTLSVYHHAVDADLTLLPVINKVDLPHADPVAASKEIASSLGLPVETHMRISAKSGLGVQNVLSNIVDNLPPPDNWNGDTRLRGLVFDTFYDHFRGVVSLVRLFSGSVKKGDKVRFLQAGKKYEVLEVGVHNPEEKPVDELYQGQVGYIVCNMKNSDEAHIGDTICLADKPVEALPGFKPMKAMVYAGVFPVDSNEFTRLEEAIERLTLNDRSVSVQRESSAALSQGFRLGFLGTLHMDVFRQRLEDEYESSVIITSPTVPFKVVYKDGTEEFISNPAEFPDTTDPKMRVAHIEEPMVNATIFVPNSYIGQMMTLCSKYRGQQVEYKVLDASDRAVLRYTLPLSEIVTDFFSELKSESSGFASFDYEEAGYEQSDLVKLNMMLNSKPVDALAMIVHRAAAQNIGRVWTKKLRSVLPRQLFEVAIQAAVGTKVLARETLSAMRKDVTAGLYGGHYERKMKHLEKQKKGKLRLKKLAGNIDVPQSAFFEVLSSRPRGYSTCARDRRSYSSQHELSTAGGLLPPAPSVPNEQAPVSIPEPILPPSLHPQVRSTMLSDVLRLADSPTASASSIYAAWTELYLASPSSHVYSPVELSIVLKALHRANVRERSDARSSSERFGIVDAELQALRAGAPEAARVGERETADLSVMADFARIVRRRRVPKAKVVNEHNDLQRRYRSVPGRPDPVKGTYSRTMMDKRNRFRTAANGMLRLAGKAGEEEIFDWWWARRIEAGFQPDAHAIMARLDLLARRRGVEEMKVYWQQLVAAMDRGYVDQAAPNFDRSQPVVASRADAAVLTNVMLWHLAKAGHWGEAAGVYDTLRRKSLADRPVGLKSEDSIPSKFFSTPADDSIPVPKHATATAETYSLLIRAATFQGDLAGGLDVMRHMFAVGLVPGVGDYCAMFDGFARWGCIGSVELENGQTRWQGDMDDWMPRPVRYSLSRRIESEDKHGLAAIWSRSKVRAPTDDTDVSLSNDMTWTADTLQVLFDTFLELEPGPPIERKSNSPVRSIGREAPSPKQIWSILLAFNRVSGGDKRAIRAAFDALQNKFAPHDSGVEGSARAGEHEWLGWRSDGRLQTVRRVLQVGQPPP